MKSYSLAIMSYGDQDPNRNALTEDKYRDLATAFRENGFRVDSVIYNDLLAEKLAMELTIYDAILVWVNPIEQGNDRKRLDALLSALSQKGCFVSAHPDVILKMGTKDVLYKTRHMEFGGDIKQYLSFSAFKEQFADPGPNSGLRILKQYRGNGGNGVFKANISQIKNNRIGLTHAKGNEEERIISADDFFEEMKIYFADDGMLIDQEWNPNIINGMVRCYLTGSRVNGFGYQEVNALYPAAKPGEKSKPPGKRYYFSQDCGLFGDLKEIMETNWVYRLQELTAVKKEMLPVIWDADFFINTPNTKNTKEKYTLCEINVSCVSPFPESAIPCIVNEVRNRIDKQKN